MSTGWRRYCLVCGYSLQGLSEPRCPECGQEFDPEDERTWASHATRAHLRAPIAASFSGTLIGWGLALAILRVAEGYFPDPWVGARPSYPIQGTVAAAVAWWLLVVLPVLRWDRSLRQGRRWWLAVGLHALMPALVVIVIPFAGGIAWTAQVLAAGAMGACIGAGIYFASRPGWLRAASSPPGTIVGLLWTVGFCCLLTWYLAVWPVICRIAPDLAFRTAGRHTQQWIFERELNKVQVGDPITKMTQPASHMLVKLLQSGRAAGGFGGRTHKLWYRVEFEDGRFTKIERYWGSLFDP